MKSNILNVIESSVAGATVDLYRFEGIEISANRREVSTARGPAALRPKTFDLLLYLIHHRDRVVAKQELLDELWHGTAVSENSVAQCIIELRKALGDDARDPHLIKTAGKAGYRFVAGVEEVEELPARVRRLSPAYSAAALAVAATLAGVGLWGRGGKPPAAADTLVLSMTSNLHAAHAYLDGVEKARQYHVAEAIARFQEAIRRDPAFAMAQARIGYAYAISSGQLEAGKPYLERAFALRDKLNDLSRLYIVAWYAQANRDYDGAIRAYRELVARFPQESEAMQQLGRVLIGEGLYDEARAVMEKALRIDPSAPAAHNTMSSVHLAAKQFDRAVDEAARFVELLPREPNALDSLGLAYEARNDFEGAERVYRQALALKQEFEIARIHLANTLYRQGRMREARAEVERHLDHTSSDRERVRGSDMLALIASRMGALAEARRRAESEPVGDHYFETLLAVRRGDLATADRLLAARPEPAGRGERGNRRDYFYALGERALAGHDAPLALRYFQQSAAERTPYFLMDWHEDGLAEAYFRLGRVDDAIQEYRRVLAVYPRLAYTWHGLAKAFQARGQTASADSAFQNAIKIWAHGDADLPARMEAQNALKRTISAAARR